MRRGASSLPSVMFGVLLLMALGTLFVLEDENNTVVAGQAVATGTATLWASPNPCTATENTCVSTLFWSTDAALPSSFVQVWRLEDPAMIACTAAGASGNLARAIAVGEPRSFALYPATDCTESAAQRTTSLAQVTIVAAGAELSDQEKVQRIVERIR